MFATTPSQDCFSGEGKTLMFVNLSPTDNSYDESLCSLRFSAKVHSVDLGKASRLVGFMLWAWGALARFFVLLP